MNTRYHLRFHRLILTVALACGASVATAADAADVEPAEQGELIGRSLSGKPIYCQAFGDGPDVLLVLATIHGNEAAGTPLVAEFARWLRAHPDQLAGHKVVIIPVANPDGMAANRRFNDNEVDLNRNFPAGNWGDADVKPHGDTPLSEPESRAIMRAVCQHFPARVVSIHQPLDCVDYDGPSEGLARVMAAKCPLKVKKLGGLPGSLGSFVGETLGRQIVTLELPKDAPHDGAKLWQDYGPALIAAMKYQSPGEGAELGAGSVGTPDER